MLPVFITSSPRKQCDFVFDMYSPNTLSSIETALSGITSLTSFFTSGVISAFVSPIILTYISQLAQKVELAESEIQVDYAQVSTISIPVPKSYIMKSFTVTYLEDELSTVWNYHILWQQYIQTGQSMNMLPLIPCCNSCIYMPVVNSTILGESTKTEVPTGATIYPRIFPTIIKRTSADKASGTLASVTVTYVRVPTISGYTPYSTISS